MAKIKLTKGEMKRQRDALKQFRRYLPTLQLKKQQLQMKILEARKAMALKQAELDAKRCDIEKWVGVLGDPGIDIKEWIDPVDIKTSTVNIAGANVPVFQDIEFRPAEYDYYAVPFWVDRTIEEMRFLMRLMAEVDTVKKQIAVLEKELRTTSQRVNLFEKVKIPECQDHIRKISIYLGDQQANAVGVSKVAKKKIEVKNLEMALA